MSTKNLSGLNATSSLYHRFLILLRACQRMLGRSSPRLNLLSERDNATQSRLYQLPPELLFLIQECLSNPEIMALRAASRKFLHTFEAPKASYFDRRKFNEVVRRGRCRESVRENGMVNCAPRIWYAVSVWPAIQSASSHPPNMQKFQSNASVSAHRESSKYADTSGSTTPV